MPIDKAEAIYSLFPIVAIVLAGAAFWHVRRSYSRADVLSRPESLSKGQLKNVVGFARTIMKNSSPHTPGYADAKRRHDAAQAELARRGLA